MSGSRRGTGGADPTSPLKITHCNMVQTLLEKHMDQQSHIASRARSVQPTVKYVDD